VAKSGLSSGNEMHGGACSEQDITSPESSQSTFKIFEEVRRDVISMSSSVRPTTVESGTTNDFGRTLEVDWTVGPCRRWLFIWQKHPVRRSEWNGRWPLLVSYSRLPLFAW
jgi:hypothetical protein